MSVSEYLVMYMTVAMFCASIWTLHFVFKVMLNLMLG